MACKGCKSKNALNIKDEETPEKLGNNYKLVILIFTLFAVYGMISLIIDIRTLFN